MRNGQNDADYKRSRSIMKGKAQHKRGEMGRKLATGAKNLEHWRKNKTTDILRKHDDRE